MPAKGRELVVQVMLKPNCGLENTRAALVVRRVRALCTAVSCHPSTVKSDPATIEYLRDHGLYIRFNSPTPEQVLMAARSSFFVDRCAIVDDPASIPPYQAGGKSGGEEGSAFSLPSAFSGADELDGRGQELNKLLARFEDVHRELRAHAETAPGDRALNGILFSHAQAVDELRTAVARSRIEPFDRIVPSLRTLVEDCSHRFGVSADLEVLDSRMALDHSVLASMEEIVKRIVRACLREGIERPEEREAAGKPPRALLRLRLEGDGSEVTCCIEHDGRAFDIRQVGKRAAERGLLARPLESYTDDEIGSLVFLPGFFEAGSGTTSSPAHFNEARSLLQHAGGRGEVRNTDRGTLEIALRFPVPFTVVEAALVRTGPTRFALPAQQIARFEAFRPEQVDFVGARSLTAGYRIEDGKVLPLVNPPGADSPFLTESPAYALLLEAAGKCRVLAVDAVDGYERISVRRLPNLLNRRSLREAGCFGYASLKDGATCGVVSVRHLLEASLEKEGERA